MPDALPPHSPHTHRAHADEQHWLFFKIVLIGGFIFIGLMLFALARSIYRDSFQVGSYISELQAKIQTEQQAQDAQESELAYAETPQFQDKTAKEFFGLRQPDEEVIVLTTTEQNPDDLLPPDLREARSERALMTNPQKWLRYLFGI